MRVKVGDYVEAGQILAVIPQEDLIKQINEAKSAPNPDEDYIAQLIAEYESRSLVLSPVSGIVLSARRTDETVSATEVLATIVKLEKYADKHQVIAYVPMAAAQKLKEGMEVQVSPEFAPGKSTGLSTGISPVLAPTRSRKKMCWRPWAICSTRRGFSPGKTAWR